MYRDAYPCDKCQKMTCLEDLDGKNDGTGNFTILECGDCYGPGYVSAATGTAEMSKVTAKLREGIPCANMRDLDKIMRG